MVYFDPFALLSMFVCPGSAGFYLLITGSCACVFPNSYVSENVSSFRCSRTGNEDWFDRDKAGGE